jgi:Flp pilus assembly protein TadG
VRKLYNRLRRENGQALVELAFVIPLVLLFLFGIIDFGLALNQQNQETNIANIAARQAAVYTTGATETCNGASKATLAAWAECESTAEGGPTLTQVCIYDTSSSPDSNSFTSGDPIQVRVSGSFGWLKLLQGPAGGLVTPIGANATMRLETPGWSSTTPSFLANPTSGSGACPAS